MDFTYLDFSKPYTLYTLSAEPFTNKFGVFIYRKD